MSDIGIAALAIVIAVVSVTIHMTVRYVANAVDEARRDAAEAWKETLAERTARSRAEAKLIRFQAAMPVSSLAPDGATAPVSKDTIRAILRANGEPMKDFVTDADVEDDDPTRP